MFIWIICGLIAALLTYNAVLCPSDRAERLVSLGMAVMVGLMGPIGLVSVVATMIDIRFFHKEWKD